MAEILFFEKPGCINGEKQKNILRKAGNDLTCINILEYPWTKEELVRFIGDKQPAEFMNHTAPDVKRGIVKPEMLAIAEAIAFMVAKPILIKRPLIEVDGIRIQGFLDERLRPYLGTWDGSEDVVTCPNLATLSCDEKKK